MRAVANWMPRLRPASRPTRDRFKISEFMTRFEIPMIDDAESLLRLRDFLPVPTRFVLEYFHVSMKLRHIDQCIGAYHQLCCRLTARVSFPSSCPLFFLEMSSQLDVPVTAPVLYL